MSVLKFIPLASSSAGNAYLLDDGKSVLLLECGLSYRRLGQLVRAAGYTVSQLAGCLVSHEHNDHARCWDRLLAAGYDVLMLRDGDDVQLDNVARTVICNNVADCHIALHWDGDGLSYDKGCFYISVPDALKSMEPVASHWQQHDALGAALIAGLQNQGAAIYKNGQMSIDLTQTSYSTIPSVDMELGNACSDHSDEALSRLADGLIEGVNGYFD